MTEAFDFLNHRLEEGDTVVLVQLGYRNLLKGTIVKLTPQKAVIAHEPTNVGQTQTTQYHNQLIKVL